MTLVNAETGEKVDLWLDQALGYHVDGDLDTDGARIVTAKIKGHASMAWLLLQSAHERKAHRAMGYGTWAEYVEREFDMSRSRSYQLLVQARVVREIGEAVSTSVDISEAEARDIAPILDEAVDAAREAVESLPDDATEVDKAEAAQSAVSNVRETTRKSESTTTETAASGDGPSESDPTSDSDGYVGQDEADAINRAFENGVDPLADFRRSFFLEVDKAFRLTNVDIERAAQASDGTERAHVSAVRDWCNRYLEATKPNHLRSVR